MSPEHIELIQRSFQEIAPIRDQAARLFYDRLFAIDPSTRPLFKTDIAKQGAKLMAALAFVVQNLEKPDAIMENVRALARRHVGYGVQDRHYASVGAALLWTLEQGLGDRFSPDVKEAWSQAYDILSQAMRDAARPVPMAMAG